MASLCLDLFTGRWQEEAETEFTTKTLDLEALYGLQMHRRFQRSAAALAATASSRWEQEAHLEGDRKCLGV